MTFTAEQLPSTCVIGLRETFTCDTSAAGLEESFTMTFTAELLSSTHVQRLLYLALV